MCRSYTKTPLCKKELAIGCNENQLKTCKALLRHSTPKVKAHTRDLFKKKRAAASHVEVIMISDDMIS